MNMDKRGLSPVVATVLLVSITLVLAVIIFLEILDLVFCGRSCRLGKSSFFRLLGRGFSCGKRREFFYLFCRILRP